MSRSWPLSQVEFGVNPSTSRKPILVDWDGFFEDSYFDSKHAYTETERCCSAWAIITVLHFLHVGYALFKQQNGEGMVAFGILALPFPLFSSLFFPLLSHSCLSIMSPPLIPFFYSSFFEAPFSSFRISLLFGFGFLVVLRNSRSDIRHSIGASCLLDMVHTICYTPLN